MNAAPPLVLAGDVGGTKTDLAVFSSAAGPRAPLAQATFRSRDYAGLDAVVREFLAWIGTGVDRAAFGVAGPVANGEAKITNLPWRMDEDALAERLALKSVTLINDLQAVAAAVPVLAVSDLLPLDEVRAAAGGAIAVIAPGTGLGEAYLVWDGTRYRAYPSEGGHADFAPVDERQAGLLSFMRRRFAHVSYELVCSGIGFPNIYAFLKDSGGEEEPAWLAERLAAADDPTPVIVAAALNAGQPCAICRAALDLFVSILGGEAGNLALKVLATGGVYLGGGIPRRILAALQEGQFIKAFRDKGRMSGLMETFPVRVILNPKAALLGAAAHAMMFNP
ncbi:MAG: glucokinase [Desulfobacterales bacterium]|jgi:glucokinase|nr:glucokinase [Desulfobacterales bacterium]